MLYPATVPLLRTDQFWASAISHESAKRPIAPDLGYNTKVSQQYPTWRIATQVPAGIRWVLVVLWMGLIFFLSSDPRSSEVTKHTFGSFNYFMRKTAHVSEFAILYLLLQYAFANVCTTAVSANTGMPSTIYRFWFNTRLVMSVILAVLYAGTDEWHQSFVPGRSSSISDVFIDSCGVLFAWIMLGVYLSCRSRTGNQTGPDQQTNHQA
jgi:VanZ family protein